MRLNGCVPLGMRYLIASMTGTTEHLMTLILKQSNRGRRSAVTDNLVTSIRRMVGSSTRLGQRTLLEHAAIQAADEIERLRAALQIAVGKLSTLPPFTNWHPEVIYKALLEDGAEEVNRG